MTSFCFRLKILDIQTDVKLIPYKAIMGHSYMKAHSPSRLYTEAHSIKALIL